MKVKDVIQTCEACPSQWDAKTEDDRNVYIRYRWGWLQIHISNKPYGDVFGLDCQVYQQQLGGEYDGIISWTKVHKILEQINEGKN